MAHTRDRLKRFSRKITGRGQKQPEIPPAAEPASITPEVSSSTGSQNAEQDQSGDGLPPTSPIPSAAPSTSITPEGPLATSSQNPQQEQSRDSFFATSPVAKSLWDRAYDALAKENPDLVEEYEELLAKEQMANSAPNETTSLQHPAPHDIDSRLDRSRRQAQLNTVIQTGLQRMEDNKTAINIAGQKIVLEDQIAKGAKLLVLVQDFIGSAVKNSPEASLVWAGVSLILPLLTNPTTAAEANRDGFFYVTSRMDYYVALEAMVRRLGQSASVDEALVSAANGHIVDLYRAILDFQLSSVLRFYRNRFKVYVRDTVTSKDWKQTLLDIKTREQTVNSDLGQINGLAARQELESLNEKSEKLLSGMDSCLSVAVQQLDVSKQQLAVTEKQVAAQEDGEQRRMLAEEQKERKKCLRLFYLTPKGKGATYDWYKSRVESRVEGTCNWFLQHENFQKWLLQDSGPLLVSADPGCGKSVLAKYLIDDGLAKQSATICYFFFKDQDQNTNRQALCALLHQLFTQKRSLVEHAMELYNDMGATLVQSEPSLWTILKDTVRDPQAGPVIFVIDALDECDESELSSLITNLEDIFRGKQLANHKFKVLMTSRPYQQVIRGFHSLRAIFQRIHIPGEEKFEAISQEINTVIHHRVEQLAERHQLSDEIKSSLDSKLLAIEHRTYLWVYLVFDHLDKGFKTTDDGIDAAIQTLPKTVNEAYDQILNRSQEDETANTVKKVLSIILAARRPLTLSEMNIAMTVNGQGRGRSIYDLDLEQDVAFKSRLRTLCGLFVNVHHDKIYFLHQTAREFLLQSSTPAPVSPDLKWHHSITIRHAHFVLAEVCMFYLDMLNSTDRETFRQGGHHGALVQYSSKYWGDHYREAEPDKGSAMVDFASRLCTPDLASHSQWASIFPERYHIRPESTTNVFVASRLGLTHVTELLLNRGADIDVTDSQGWTALMHAARYGYESLTRLLLKNHANVEVKDTRGMTALILAAEHDHEVVARLLLEHGANIDAKNDDSWTALMHAARYGYKPVTRLLLKSHADVEMKSTRGMTALVLAARHGHEVDAQLLLEHGANIDATSDGDWTTLMHAAWYGCEPVIRLLLGKGAKVEVKDKRGMTALILAAEHGHEAATLLLLENGANIDAKNNDGWTALMHAAWYGYEPVTRLLLGKGADVEIKNKRGMTALILAAERGREVDARLLLENGANIDAKNNDSWTALMHSARYGFEPVTRLLLKNHAGVEVKSKRGMTALILAAERGHEADTLLLLEHGANIDAKNNDNWTALMHAARYGFEPLTRLLLKKGADVGVESTRGMTALVLASEHGHEATTRLLHETGPDIDAKDV